MFSGKLSGRVGSVIGILAVAVVSAGAANLTSEPTKSAGVGAKLEVEKKTLDLGEMWAGQTKKGTFVLRNVGDQTLTIRAKAQCGCTVVKTYDKEIAPGQQGKLPVVFNTRGMQGKVRKTITLSTNQKGKGQVRLFVAATVKRLIVTNPKGGAIFGRIGKDQVLTKEVELTNYGDGPLELELIKSTSPQFTGQLRTVEEGQKYVLTVQTQPPLPKGSYHGQFVFKTNLEKMPKLTIRAHARVDDRVTVLPRRIRVFRPFKKAGKRFAYLRNYGKEPISIIDYSVSGGLKVEVITRKKGESYSIIIQVPAGYLPPEGGDKLVIKTDDEEFGEFVVPIVRTKLPKKRPTTKRSIKAVPASRPTG